MRQNRKHLQLASMVMELGLEIIFKHVSYSLRNILLSDEALHQV
jgi:hypothetical protein